MNLSKLIVSVVSTVGNDVATTVGLIAMDMLLSVMNHHTLNLNRVFKTFYIL